MTNNQTRDTIISSAQDFISDKAMNTLTKKVALKGALKAVPGIGTASLAYDASEFAYEAITGEEFSDTQVGKTVESATEGVLRAGIAGISKIAEISGFSETSKDISQTAREVLFNDISNADTAMSNKEKLNSLSVESGFNGQQSASEIIGAAIQSTKTNPPNIISENINPQNKKQNSIGLE